jgi:hypothetical protein
VTAFTGGDRAIPAGRLTKGEMYSPWLHRDPLLAPLHSHPSLQELLRLKG